MSNFSEHQNSIVDQVLIQPFGSQIQNESHFQVVQAAMLIQETPSTQVQTTNQHQLDFIHYHHQSSQFINNLISDPFAIQNDCLYVPEVICPNSAHQQANQIQSQSEFNVKDQQEEIFDDIVANTNPVLAALPDAEQIAMANLCMNHNYTFFNAKSNLLRISQNLQNEGNRQRVNRHINFFSENDSQIERDNLSQDEDIFGKDLEFDDCSSIDQYDNTQIMLEFLRLKPMRDNEIGGYFVDPTLLRQNRQEQRTRERIQVFDKNLIQFARYEEIQSEFNPFEDRRALEVELEDCENQVGNRSQCCGGEDGDFFKDIGLDSTMSYSIKDEDIVRNSLKNRTRDQGGNRAQSLNRRAIFGKQRGDRNAFSQMNLEDLESEQDKYQDQYKYQEAEDQFNMAIVDEENEKQFLQFDKSNSQKFGQCFLGNINSQIYSSGQKTDLRKRRNTNIELEQMTQKIETPCQNQKMSNVNYNKFIISQDQNQINSDPLSIQNEHIPSTFNQSLFEYYMNPSNGSAENKFNEEPCVQKNERINYSQKKSYLYDEILRMKEKQNQSFNQNYKINKFNLELQNHNVFSNNIDKLEFSSSLIFDRNQNQNIQSELFKSTIQNLQICGSQKSEQQDNSKVTSSNKKSKHQKARVRLIKKQKKHENKPFNKKNLRRNKNQSNTNIQHKVHSQESQGQKIENQKEKNEQAFTFENKLLNQEQQLHKEKSQSSVDQLYFFDNKENQYNEQAQSDITYENLPKISIKTDRAKYYQNFDFFFKRSCFRIMTEFYKDKFNMFFKERMSQLKKHNNQAWQAIIKEGGLTSIGKEEMNIIISEFIDKIFGNQILQQKGELLLNKEQRRYFLLKAMMVLFSHRYTKNDKFIEENMDEGAQLGELQPIIDFTIIRDVMYKYSKKAQDKYFSQPVESFMFAAFALSDEGLAFLRDKPDNVKDSCKLKRLLRDLHQLKDQAINSLCSLKKACSLHQNENLIQQKRNNIIAEQIGSYLFVHLQRITKGQL